MNVHQTSRPTTVLRRPGDRSLIGLAMLIALVAAGFATQRITPPAPQGAPAVNYTPARWSPSYMPGGHPTGSVYDGGAYGSNRTPARWSPSYMPGGHPTGSVYGPE